MHRFYRSLLDVYKRLYPYANAAYELSNLFYNLQYLFDQSPYWRPFDAWLKVDIRRLSGEDYVSYAILFGLTSLANSPGYY